MNFILVFLGGGAGSVCRYALSKLINEKALFRFPFGTFTVNAVGCFLIGLLFASFEKSNAGQEVRLLLITGFLGGFTTFSSFNLENALLIRNSDYLNSAANILLSVAVGLAFVFLGLLAGSRLHLPPGAR